MADLTDELILERLQFGFTLWRSRKSGIYRLQHGNPGCGGEAQQIRGGRVRAMVAAGKLEPAVDPDTKADIFIPAGSGTYTVSE